MKKEKCKIRDNGYLTEKTLTNIKIKYRKINAKSNDNERAHAIGSKLKKITKG